MIEATWFLRPLRELVVRRRFRELGVEFGAASLGDVAALEGPHTGSVGNVDRVAAVAKRYLHGRQQGAIAAVKEMTGNRERGVSG